MNIKKNIYAIIIFFSTIMLTSCGNEVNKVEHSEITTTTSEQVNMTSTVAPAEIPTAIPNPDIRVIPLGVNNDVTYEEFLENFNAGKLALLPPKFRFDLDADGVEESVELLIYEQGEEYYDSETVVAALINGKEYKIFTVENNDTYQMTWGAKNSTFYGILSDNKCIIEVFMEKGAYCFIYEEGKKGLVYAMDENVIVDNELFGITTYRESYVPFEARADSICHFFKIPVKTLETQRDRYQLQGVEVPYGKYTLCDATATLKCDLPLYKNIYSEEIVSKITAGSDIFFVATDESGWIYVGADLNGWYSNGGWIRYNKNQVLVNGAELDWDDVFDNYTVCYDKKRRTEDIYFSGTSKLKAEKMEYLPEEFVEDIGNDTVWSSDKVDDKVVWSYEVQRNGEKDQCNITFTINDKVYEQNPVQCEGKLSDVTLSKINTTFGSYVLIAELHYSDKKDATVAMYQFTRNKIIKIFEFYGALDEFICRGDYVSSFTVFTYEDKDKQVPVNKKYHFVDYWYLEEVRDTKSFEIRVAEVPDMNFAELTYGTYAKKDFQLRKDVYSDEYGDTIHKGEEFCIVVTDGVEWCYIESATAKGWIKVTDEDYVIIDGEKIHMYTLFKGFTYFLAE